ncbi:MAG: TspO/MBR family protein [Candidatus Gastranaerophilaceae bacterium]
MFEKLWYTNLTKPPLTPPAEVFAPTWTILYTFMALSLYLYLTKKSVKSKTAGYVYFSIQIILNLLWTPVFFGLQNVLAASVLIMILDIFVVMTIVEFRKISKLAGILLIPYFLWLVFATYLAFGILIMN